MPMPVTETVRELALPGGPLRYLLRRTARARTLRVTIHPERGVVVSIPPASRRGWARPDEHVERFLADRERWIRDHLARQALARRALAARPSLGEGRAIPFLGLEHVVRIVHSDVRTTPSGVRQVTTEGEEELWVEMNRRDPRSAIVVLEAWLRERARAAIEASIARHAGPLGLAPARVTLRDPRSRWGSCSRAGRLSISWRLILAPPEALDSVVAHELCHLRVFGHGPRFKSLLASRVPQHARWRRWLHDHAAELHAALDPGTEAATAAA
jgi:predicted metal-dependent hydrolase